MARAVKRKKQTASPKQMAKIRDTYTESGIMFEERSRPLRDIGPGDPDHSTVWTLKVKERMNHAVGDFFGLVFDVLKVDLKGPHAATCIKLDTLSKLAGDYRKCLDNKDLKKEFYYIQKKLQATKDYLQKGLLLGSTEQELQVALYRSMIDMTIRYNFGMDSLSV